MSGKRPSRLASLPHLLREQIELLPDRWGRWRDGLREDPGILWRAPVVRTAGLVLLGIVTIVAVGWLVGALTPGGADNAAERATPWATLYVACTNPACRAEGTTQQRMDFSGWPLKCAKCGALSVYRASRCPECRRWYAVRPGEPRRCPFCAERAKAEEARAQPEKPQTHTDDDEDPW